jgi:TRAP-type transport system small permease protein
MTLLERVNRGLYLACTGICLFCLAVITIALSAQILARYVFNVPLQYTDDMAEIALVWLTFFGAAVLYREAGHIAITALPDLLPPRGKAALRVAVAVMAIGALILVMKQVNQIAPMMSRVTYGSLPTIPFYSKFVALFVPLGVGSAVTVLFALTDIIADIRFLLGGPPPPTRAIASPDAGPDASMDPGA